MSGSNRPFVLPDWVPEVAWNAYVEMRRRIRKPLTEYAKHLAVLELDKLRSAGYGPEPVLHQSIFNSWQGLFPLKAQPKPIVLESPVAHSEQSPGRFERAPMPAQLRQMVDTVLHRNKETRH